MLLLLLRKHLLLLLLLGHLLLLHRHLLLHGVWVPLRVLSIRRNELHAGVRRHCRAARREAGMGGEGADPLVLHLLLLLLLCQRHLLLHQLLLVLLGHLLLLLGIGVAIGGRHHVGRLLLLGGRHEWASGVRGRLAHRGLRGGGEGAVTRRGVLGPQRRGAVALLARAALGVRLGLLVGAAPRRGIVGAAPRSVRILAFLARRRRDGGRRGRGGARVSALSGGTLIIAGVSKAPVAMVNRSNRFSIGVGVSCIVVFERGGSRGSGGGGRGQRRLLEGRVYCGGGGGHHSVARRGGGRRGDGRGERVAVGIAKRSRRANAAGGLHLERLGDG